LDLAGKTEQEIAILISFDPMGTYPQWAGEFFKDHPLTPADVAFLQEYRQRMRWSKNTKSHNVDSVALAQGATIVYTPKECTITYPKGDTLVVKNAVVPVVSNLPNRVGMMRLVPFLTGLFCQSKGEIKLNMLSDSLFDARFAALKLRGLPKLIAFFSKTVMGLTKESSETLSGPNFASAISARLLMIPYDDYVLLN